MTVYKGGPGQWAWALHRISGVAVLLFLLMHILDTSLILLGPAWYNKLIAFYRHPVMGIMEIGLYAAVLYHSLNGIRITIMDFWLDSIAHHRRMLLVQMILFLFAFVPVAWIMLRHTFLS